MNLLLQSVTDHPVGELGTSWTFFFLNKWFDENSLGTVMPLVIDTYRTDDTILSLVEKKTLSLLSVHNGVHSAPCRWPARSPHCSWLTSSLRPSSVTGSGPASHFSASVGFFFLTELRLSDEVRRVSLADGVQQREPDAERLPERRQRLDEPIDGHHRRGAAARLSRVPRPAHPQSTTAQHRSSTGLSISVYRSVLLFFIVSRVVL